MASTFEELLSLRIEEATEPAFLDARVAPHLGDNKSDTWEVEIVQLDSTGAATVRIGREDGRAVFAKFFPNGAGPAVYDKLRALRASGFGPGHRYQVVEPLDYVPEYHLLLCRGAEGAAVSESVAVDDAVTRSGVREAAVWLARLHTSPVRHGKPYSLVVSSEVLSVARRLAKVAAERPDHVALAVSMVEELERLSEDTVDGLAVQSHGQYRPIHVFVGEEAVTVIDLDRSRPADPARDVAEFLHRLRTRTYWDAGSVERAEAPTEVFLEAYLSVAPAEYLTNLRFQWARYVFHSLNRKIKTGGRDEDRSLGFYRSEFDKLVDGRLGRV